MQFYVGVQGKCRCQANENDSKIMDIICTMILFIQIFRSVLQIRNQNRSNLSV